ncbi:MAG: choice-of-anchor J domain-containing protein [Crocinitomicaceae bacterium]|nr:choice-of-anchor J domain-containing protein [Crocinitomicaceae bacterium]
MRLSLVAVCSLLFSNSFAQSVLFFEDFNSGIPSTWAMVDNDGLTPAEAVDTFDNAWISFIDDTDTCAASTSYYTPTGQAADYLISPKISLNTFTKLVWSARSYDASYADDYLVLISSTDSLIGSFTDTLMVVEEEYYYWHLRSVQLDLEGYSNEDVYIAFKNITNDGYILMLDDVKVMGSDFASVAENETSSISVYPNPTADFIQINGADPDSIYTYYSITGELLFTGTSSRMDVSTLQPGTYFVQVRSTDNVVTVPFIKQ